MNRELKIFAAMLGVFGVAYVLPLSNPQVENAILEAFKLLQWYARNHTLACVVPAIFIAGAITTFLSQASVMKHLGPRSPKKSPTPSPPSSGGILAVCSCSVLPMFAGIYRLGAGLGPASAFLYSGPAINVLAIFLTARVLGFDIGLARALGAVVFAVVIGLLMATIFRREEREKAEAAMQLPEPPAPARPLWKNAVFLVVMIAFLVFSDWYNPGDAVVRLDGRQRDEGRRPAGNGRRVHGPGAGSRRRDVREGDHVTLAKGEIRETRDDPVLGHGHLAHPLVARGPDGAGRARHDVPVVRAGRAPGVDEQLLGLREDARAPALRRGVRRRASSPRCSQTGRSRRSSATTVSPRTSWRRSSARSSTSPP